MRTAYGSATQAGPYPCTRLRLESSKSPTWAPATSLLPAAVIRAMRRALVLAGVVVGMVPCGQALSNPAASTPKPAPFHQPASWGVFLLGGEKASPIARSAARICRDVLLLSYLPNYELT